ncbi:MAG: SRPBCC domain-containing protein [Gemmatimonadota bacterium]|nr:SRPBCC domain-containing protein [Gemmatimonadota bacterium]
MKTIIHTAHIHASPSDVYRALTTEKGVTGWWTTRASVEPGTGGLIRFTFHGDFHPHMEQTRLDEPENVEWTCVAGHDNWQDNRFSFALRERGGETSLRFTQRYAQELDDDIYGTYNFNWGYYLLSLKKLCEEGEGTPFEPPAA